MSILISGVYMPPKGEFRHYRIYDDGDVTVECCGQEAVIAKAVNAEDRRRGEWGMDNECSLCGFQPWFERDIHTLNYCPHCGADMRGYAR